MRVRAGDCLALACSAGLSLPPHFGAAASKVLETTSLLGSNGEAGAVSAIQLTSMTGGNNSFLAALEQ